MKVWHTTKPRSVGFEFERECIIVCVLGIKVMWPHLEKSEGSREQPVKIWVHAGWEFTSTLSS